MARSCGSTPTPAPPGRTTPTSAAADANAQQIIAYGLRNPFRITIRGNGSVWLGDVGFTTWEEINTIPDPDAAPRNFGWPCREGNAATPQYAGLDIPLCDSPPALAGPGLSTYNHNDTVDGDDGCGTGSSSISGIAFRTTAGNYPAKYDNGLFFSDYTRRCIWFAPGIERDRQPDFSVDRAVRQPAPLGRDRAAAPSAWASTPAGDIIYTDYDRDEIRAIRYYPAAPAERRPSPRPRRSGRRRSTVDFDASASNDPNGDAMIVRLGPRGRRHVRRHAA